MIITHPGRAHVDDFLACAYIVAMDGRQGIYRREPTEGELSNPNVWVVDVGGQFDPAKRNFDHHQFPREAPASCAFTLVVHYDKAYESAVVALPWLRRVEINDSKGPVESGKYFAEVAGLESYDPDRLREAMLTTLSPIERAVLNRFAEREQIAVDDPLMDLLEAIGTDLRQTVWSYQEAERRILSTPLLDVVGLQVLDLRSSFSADEQTHHESVCTHHELPVDVVLLNSNRDAGCSVVVRREIAREKVDFSVLEGRPGVRFAHKNGFMAVLEPGVELGSLLGVTA